jgi:hypothetical protein
MGITVQELTALEQEVWRALVAGDPASDERLLSDDFLGVYQAGYAGRGEHVEQLADGPTVCSFELSEVRMLAISDLAALLVYRADYVRADEDGEREAMYVSSLWCVRGGRWVNVFSQDTPATGEEVV